MNCQDISKIICEYCDGEVSPEQYTNISQHLNQCTDCQYIYQLTSIENEILREKGDIPNLSPAFTSLVISSLQSDKNLNIKSRSFGINRKLWLSSLTTVAAVVALFLYLPHQSFINSNIINNNNSSISEQSSSSSSIAAPQYDSPVIAGQTNLTPSSKPTESKDTTSVASKNSTKSAPITDNLIVQPLILAGSESSAEAKPTAAPNVSRSLNSDSILAGSSTVSLRPQNIPDRLEFIQMNNNEDKTVFDYASLDGTEYLQLTLVPYSEPTIRIKSEFDTHPQEPLTLYREIQIEDKKITAIFTGNLPVEEMTRLADTIQFQDTSSN